MPDESIKVRCENCWKVLKAPASTTGRKSTCPNCGSPITIEADPELEIVQDVAAAVSPPLSQQQQNGPWLRNDTPQKGKKLQVIGSDHYILVLDPARPGHNNSR